MVQGLASKIELTDHTDRAAALQSPAFEIGNYCFSEQVQTLRKGEIVEPGHDHIRAGFSIFLDLFYALIWSSDYAV